MRMKALIVKTVPGYNYNTFGQLLCHLSLYSIYPPLNCFLLPIPYLLEESKFEKIHLLPV